MTRKAASLPPLPSSVMGIAGPIRIELVEMIEPDATGKVSVTWGIWEPHKRLVRILNSVDRSFQWSVLYHELVHAALSDTGLGHLISAEHEEAFCDALATARVCEAGLK